MNKCKRQWFGWEDHKIYQNLILFVTWYNHPENCSCTWGSVVIGLRNFRRIPFSWFVAWYLIAIVWQKLTFELSVQIYYKMKTRNEQSVTIVTYKNCVICIVFIITAQPRCVINKSLCLRYTKKIGKLVTIEANVYINIC